MRAVQGALASGSCAAVVLLLRRHRRIQVVWLAPAAAVLGRLLLDPTMFSYYLVPVCLVAIVGAGWCLDARSRWPEVVSIAALIYLPFLFYGALALPSVVLSLAATALSVVAARRGEPLPGSPDRDFFPVAVNRTGAGRVAHSEV
jgi:cytochrome bd-type quinol oxidase subunit 2